jgi:hypothetical protein
MSQDGKNQHLSNIRTFSTHIDKLYAMRTEHFESKSVFYENTEIIWQKQKQSEKHSVEKLL